MLTFKFFADFVMQKTFKARSSQLDMARCQFVEHFTLKVQYMPKNMHAFDENWLLCKFAARQTLYFGEIKHFQRQMCGQR